VSQLSLIKRLSTHILTGRFVGIKTTGSKLIPLLRYRHSKTAEIDKMIRSLLFCASFPLIFAVTISVDSFQSGNEGSKGIDGNTATFWHTQYTPSVAALPHWAIIDLGVSTSVKAFTYRPRQDGSSNGNIGQYQISLSPNNATWTMVSAGSFADDASLKTVSFTSASARYVRITALTEAGGRGSWSSASEFSVTPVNTDTSKGLWGSLISFPLVPAAAFMTPTGNIVTFSSFARDTFGGPHGYTLTATHNPTDSSVSQLNVSNTGHDMFCPGMSLDANGRAIITGGDDAAKTSIYDPAVNAWSSGSNMQISRGYQASATTSNGLIFTIGGSWSGGRGGKNGEIYNTATNTWSLLSGCPVAPMLTNDTGGIFRQDNHGWLFGWKNGYVFQAGPSKAMNWYGTTGSGSRTTAGLRASDSDSMDGNAVMYDAVAGKIATFGGSPNYEQSTATNNVHLITIGSPPAAPSVLKLTSMTYQRAFANGVVLPNGQIMITGGQSFAVPFSDDTAIMNPELWDPVSQTFTILPAHDVPRTYHSVALLILDGRVFTGGGGVCGSCATNHPNAQIYSPSYLFNTDGTAAVRPIISSISSTTVAAGKTISITMNTAATTFSIIRFGSATHTVNTDQRRISLIPITTSGLTYTFTIPSDSGVALPGYWMLFAMNSAGVPSVAKAIRITVA
jgi:galactose oxidase